VKIRRSAIARVCGGQSGSWADLLRKRNAGPVFLAAPKACQNDKIRQDRKVAPSGLVVSGLDVRQVLLPNQLPLRQNVRERIHGHFRLQTGKKRCSVSVSKSMPKSMPKSMSEEPPLSTSRTWISSQSEGMVPRNNVPHCRSSFPGSVFFPVQRRQMLRSPTTLRCPSSGCLQERLSQTAKVTFSASKRMMIPAAVAPECLASSPGPP